MQFEILDYFDGSQYKFTCIQCPVTKKWTWYYSPTLDKSFDISKRKKLVRAVAKLRAIQYFNNPHLFNCPEEPTSIAITQTFLRPDLYINDFVFKANGPIYISEKGAFLLRDKNESKENDIVYFNNVFEFPNSKRNEFRIIQYEFGKSHFYITRNGEPIYSNEEILKFDSNEEAKTCLNNLKN